MPELPPQFADGRLPARFLPTHRPVVERAAGGCPDPNRCAAVMPADGSDPQASCTRCRAGIAVDVSPSETAG